MKLVVQRVESCTVETSENKKIVGSIECGLFILIGIKKGDTVDTAIKLARKVANLRIFSDTNGKMNHSALDQSKSILVVSQFTLNADTSRGQRPSFVTAEQPRRAQALYMEFVSELKSFGIDVQTGKFGEYMKIQTELDGPVTILFDEK
ncbi:D-tyrosyl-tRNA(Tyr) deacylase [Candidatus Woesebacteria bacterium RIFCSPHIGHO2_01_FULL_41_10]|uniref:D-aminoacyl-tRNA deacylase n=1 Tax=Candidatus Woesebacteria bacterium RIFCSPHIGHO2_01_FULL_41_10 TaxID=1802500 RepID=A0A1F7YSP4_9BACT|nr:MAG: D-tyrosyl-tRNA(Tyr) deacylase [Candidatus Woesebacteria bacterium RIFCSPHIGHO2_01_FULL_41_10]